MTISRRVNLLDGSSAAAAEVAGWVISSFVLTHAPMRWEIGQSRRQEAHDRGRFTAAQRRQRCLSQTCEAA